MSAQCAICVVNLRTGDIEHRLEIGGIVEEIYDVNLLPNVIRPMPLGFRNAEKPSRKEEPVRQRAALADPCRSRTRPHSLFCKWPPSLTL